MRLFRSLTLRMAAAFALIAMIVVSATGLFLYHSAKHSLLERSDNTVLNRLNHYRDLFRYNLTLAELKARPQLFQGMLGDENDVLILRQPHRSPVVAVNPWHVTLPELAPVAEGRPLAHANLRSGMTANGTPLRAASVMVQIGSEKAELIVAHILNHEMAMLAEYRTLVYEAMLTAFLATALFGYIALYNGLRPLRRLATQAATIRPTTLATHRLRLDHGSAELDQLTTTFNAMLDRLEDGYQRLTQFSADLAHEIRTPINAIMGHCQVALGQTRSADEYQALLVANLEALERIARLVENILFLARADDAREVITLKRLEMSDEAERVMAYFEALADERSLTFRLEGRGVLQADPILLRRALSNLLANAIRHALEGSEIAILIETTPAACSISVENRMAGKAPEHIERLFDRFYRGDAARHDGDSNGLGLAIVAAIMKLHSGQARAELSASDRIRFTLNFPTSRENISGLAQQRYNEYGNEIARAGSEK